MSIEYPVPCRVNIAYYHTNLIIKLIVRRGSIDMEQNIPKLEQHSLGGGTVLQQLMLYCPVHTEGGGEICIAGRSGHRQASGFVVAVVVVDTAPLQVVG